MIAPPHFGAGTADVRIVIGSGVDVETLEVVMDGEVVSDRFQAVDDAPKPEGQTVEVRGTIRIGSGEHELFARAKSKSGAADATNRLRFSSPPALEVLEIGPANNAAGFIRSDWIRLDLGAPALPEAIDSIGLSCDRAPHEFSIHRIGDTRIVIDPSPDLPPGARCRLVWRGKQGPRSRRLEVGPTGPKPTVLYDRRELGELAPFPDDFWLATNPDDPNEYGVRLRTAGFGLPDQWFINALATAVRSLDGFSPLGHFTVALSSPADPASLPSSYSESMDADASVMLFDVTPDHPDYGARVPFRIEARSEAIRGPRHHGLLIFPSIALESRHRYGLVVTRRVRSTEGQPFGPSGFFAEVRDSGPSPSNWIVGRARELLDDVLAAASNAAIPISRLDVAFAARFSIRSLDGIEDDLVRIQRLTSESSPPTIAQVSVERPDDTGADADGTPAIAAIVRGSWDSTHWLDKQSRIHRDPETGLPVANGSQRLQFTMALPRAAFDRPVPVVMYQHGNPGSAEDEVILHASRYLAAAGFAVVGFDDVLNRQTASSRLSTAERASRQVADILLRIIASSQMPDYFLQTIADQIRFVRAIDQLASIAQFVLPAGATDSENRTLFGIDAQAPLLYLGVSEGAHHGSMLLPFAPGIRAAALISPGRRFSEILIHQGSDQLLSPLRSLGFGRLSPTDIWVTLALIQMMFDAQDPHNFARFLYREPLDIAPKQRASVLMAEGLGDSLVPNHATNSLARAFGSVAHLSPAADPVPGLDAVSDSVAGNVDASTTAALYQFVPLGTAGIASTPGCASPPLSEASAREGHYCAQSSPESIAQRLEFFRTALEAGIPSASDPPATRTQSSPVPPVVE